MLKSRIAPTPSGFLHRGNAFNFLLTSHLVVASNGSLLLRIDDIDRGRYRPIYVDYIFQTLDYLGIKTDQGPRQVADFEQLWSQHKRLQNYKALLGRLLSTKRVYACNCSRKMVKENAIDGLYAGTCRNKGLALDTPNVNWRINTEGVNEVVLPAYAGTPVNVINLEQAMGDFVIHKKDGLPAYQICSLTDDLHFGINLIVRGEDLLNSSGAQIWLAQLLGENDWLEQLSMLHHPLLRGSDGEKLSKSAGAAAIADLKEDDFKAMLIGLRKALDRYLKEIQG